MQAPDRWSEARASGPLLLSPSRSTAGLAGATLLDGGTLVLARRIVDSESLSSRGRRPRPVKAMEEFCNLRSWDCDACIMYTLPIVASLRLHAIRPGVANLSHVPFLDVWSQD